MGGAGIPAEDLPYVWDAFFMSDKSRSRSEGGSGLGLALADRIVKLHFRKNEHPCICPREFPLCVCGKQPKGICITKKPVLPTEAETKENSRAKSAKLRVFEKI